MTWLWHRSRRPSRPALQRRRSTAADRYERIARAMLDRYAIRVRRWRQSTTGAAWETIGADGQVTRWIEAPRPRGPVSAAVFLHEVGHHAIGFRRYRPRCLEEYHAWAFAIREMERHGLTVTPRVRARMVEALQYAVEKARRRGLRRIPPELMSFRIRP